MGKVAGIEDMQQPAAVSTKQGSEKETCAWLALSIITGLCGSPGSGEWVYNARRLVVACSSGALSSLFVCLHINCNVPPVVVASIF